MPSDLKLEELPEAGELIEVTLDDYGHTGESFVRLADGWLSVRGAMPGERVMARLEAGHPRSRRRFAQVVEVLSAHSARQSPQCERAAQCRGCQLRHVSLAEESRYKERTIREVLERYGGWSREEQPAIELIAPAGMTRGDGWRVRSSLTYRKLGPGQFELGLVSPASASLIPMGDCPALSEPARRLVLQVRASLEELATRGQLPEDGRGDGSGASDATRAVLSGVRLAAPAHGRGFVELKQSGGDGEVSAEVFALAEALDGRLSQHVSVFVEVGERYERIRGPERMRLSLGGLVLEVDPRDWFHATLEPAEVLYEHVDGLLELRAGERFLDVGCGVGTLALRAARRGHIAQGIDAKWSSIQSAEANAARLGLSELASFRAGSWEVALKKLMIRGERFDVATINPMREPLGERALLCLSGLGVERIVYLGPSPTSAARDLGLLRERGWELDRLGGAMLHPATYHVMLVARMRRRALPG